MQQSNWVRKEIGRFVLELTQGDIAKQDGFDAVVNAANAYLMPGGGVAGALHRAAGPGLAEEGRPMAPIAPGEAVITAGHNLPNPWVIHCLGPIYGQDRPEDRLLASCYREALRIAEEKGLRSVAFPALSTGAFGYPMEPAARIALGTVLDMAPDLRSVRHVRFVLYGQRDLQVHQEVLEELTGGATTGEA
jgi:O-acetyl-ADP-ribose deacetylase (regulator of RNase III)